MSFPLATEEEEQAVLTEWLDLVGLRYWHTPNSTFTKSWSVKARNHRMGVKRGIPDLFVVIPPHRSRDNRGHLLGMELKRVKGGVVAPEQKEWIDALNAIAPQHIDAQVCRGAQESMDFINKYLRPSPRDTSPF